MKYLTLCCVFILMLSASVSSQEAKKYSEDTEWKWVVKVNYKPGKRDEAIKIIKDHFMKATEKAELPGPEKVMEMQTGDFDLLIIWHMQDGVNDLMWETHPNDVKWMKAMQEMAGSEEKSKDILSQYGELVDWAEGELAVVRKW